MHDLRGSGPQTVTSITAHTKAVQGLALDPWEPHHVATYSDNPLEPIKVWDLRKVRQTQGAAGVVILNCHAEEAWMTRCVRSSVMLFCYYLPKSSLPSIISPPLCVLGGRVGAAGVGAVVERGQQAARGGAGLVPAQARPLSRDAC